MTVKLVGSSSGSMSIAAPATTTSGANRTITLNDTYGGDGTFVTANSSGNVGIGTSSPACDLHVSAANPRARFTSTGNTVNYDVFMGSTNATVGTSSNHDTLFMTNDSERMRILANGKITTNGNTDLPTGSTSGFGFSTDQFYLSYTGTSANYSQRFYNGNGLVGSILVNGSSTAYNTSSDYRLKENASAISDGITRLKELKPYKFNFKADKSKTLDGFFAHEAQAVVPESATGVKDEVDSDNKPVYQGIDQSKLVPLLTAALQEAVAKIETLETKVAALEAK